MFEMHPTLRPFWEPTTVDVFPRFLVPVDPRFYLGLPESWKYLKYSMFMVPTLEPWNRFKLNDLHIDETSTYVMWLGRI